MAERSAEEKLTTLQIKIELICRQLEDATRDGVFGQNTEVLVQIAAELREAAELGTR